MAEAAVKAAKAVKAPKAAKAPKAPKEPKVKGLKIPYERRKALYGYGFLAIWIIGTLYFFIRPLITSFWYSLNKTTVTIGQMSTEFIGIQNYIDTFTKDTDYTEALLTVLKDTLWKTPIIIIFSILIAVILNQKFRGRTLARAIFFLPVLIATGPVISVINGDMTSQGVSDAAQFSTLFKTDLVTELMEFLGIYNLNQTFTDIIKDITSGVLNLVWNSGIQILIFLSALQTIPPSAKEAASIEGATAWEFFWKITFPYISPMILSNLVYTVIDAFVSTDNVVMEYVLAQSRNWEYGYSAALAWIYFAIVGACLGIICVIINRFVYYEND